MKFFRAKRFVPAILLLCLSWGCGTLKNPVSGTGAAETAWEQKEVGLVGQPQGSPDRTETAPDSTRTPVTAPVAESVPETTLPLSDQVIAYARTFLGTPYKLGASGPRQFDCSGFTRYVFKHFGYDITQYSGAQFRQGRIVESYADLQKGDLVFFGKRARVRDIGHVGIVVQVDHERGAFRFIHASTSGGVKEEDSNHPYFMMRYLGARRLLPDEPHQH